MFRTGSSAGIDGLFSDPFTAEVSFTQSQILPDLNADKVSHHVCNVEAEAKPE